MIKVDLALGGGMKMAIPSQSFRTIEAVAEGRFGDAPNVRCGVRFLIANELRTRFITQTHEEVMELLRNDTVAAKTAWSTVELPNQQYLTFRQQDILAAEQRDPEDPMSQKCTALVDLDIDGITVPSIHCNADIDDLLAQPEPIQPQPPKK